MLIYLKESMFLYSAYTITIKVIHNYKSHIYVLVKATFQCNRLSEMRSSNKAEIKCVNIFSATLYGPYYIFMNCFSFDERVGFGLEKLFPWKTLVLGSLLSLSFLNLHSQSKAGQVKIFNLPLMLLILFFACNYLVKGSPPLAPYSRFHVLMVPL